MASKQSSPFQPYNLAVKLWEVASSGTYLKFMVEQPNTKGGPTWQRHYYAGMQFKDVQKHNHDDIMLFICYEYVYKCMHAHTELCEQHKTCITLKLMRQNFAHECQR